MTKKRTKKRKEQRAYLEQEVVRDLTRRTGDGDPDHGLPVARELLLGLRKERERKREGKKRKGENTCETSVETT